MNAFTHEVSVAEAADATSPAILAGGATLVGFSVGPVGAAVTALALQVQFAIGGSWFTYLTGAGWAATDDYSVRRVSGTNPNTVADSAEGWGVVKLPPCYAIRFVAAMAGEGVVTFAGGTNTD